MLKWRNEEILEGSVLTAVDVPNELVQDVISLFGKHCLIMTSLAWKRRRNTTKNTSTFAFTRGWGKRSCAKIRGFPTEPSGSHTRHQPADKERLCNKGAGKGRSSGHAALEPGEGEKMVPSVGSQHGIEVGNQGHTTLCGHGQDCHYLVPEHARMGWMGCPPRETTYVKQR